TLNITNGGSVSATGTTYVGSGSGTGVINFGSNGGTLTTRCLWTASSQLTGTGTVNARGLVTDIDLVFDATHGLSQTTVLNSLANQNIAINLDMSTAANNGDLGLGYEVAGSLMIKDGIAVTSVNGFLGYQSGSTGTASVDGSGSKWTNSSTLYVGNYGSGSLAITGGGSVSDTRGYIGRYSSSTSSVTVGGSGSTWTNSDNLYVGYSGSGTLTITGGGSVSSDSYGSYIGYNSGSTGTATVDGAGSMWTNSSDLCVGLSGGGTINITNGGSVSVAGTTYVGKNGGTGVINFGSNGGTLATRGLLAASSRLTGTGTVNARGLVTDIDLVFDATHGLSQTTVLNSLANQNITINLDMSTAANNGALGVGYEGAGSLMIKDGIAVTSVDGYLGYQSGSTGTATVDGSGSKWTNSGSLYVGYSGSGSLAITGGGSVSNGVGTIGYYNGSTSTVTVDGSGSTWTNGVLYVGYWGSGSLAITGGGSVSSTTGHIGYSLGRTGKVIVGGSGSTWTNSGSLYVGYSGTGTLRIYGGGTVTAWNVSNGSASLLAIDVGCGSSLSVNSGGGTMTNNGTIRLLAGAGATAGTSYSPIAAKTWGGTGTYQALGGTWNTTTHQFTASSVQATTSGSAASLDLTSIQRALVSDSTTGWEVGASFLATTSSTPITFTATAITGSTLTSLESELTTFGETVRSGWTFSTSNYTVSSAKPVYVSLAVGSGFLVDDLNLWHYDGSVWTSYTADDLAYDGTYASFTVTSFNGYAVSAVPEPGTLMLLVAGLFGVAAYAWRCRNRRPA
ncbi:MAG: PEP-CTERM sorting domain-containing protein, partial [Thermoguttaceae bacterium]